MAELQIGDHTIGKDSPVFIVAEMSCSHMGNVEIAREMIRAAARAGADAVKLQTFTADTMTLDSDRPEFRLSGTQWDKHKTLYQLYKEAETPWEWHGPLKELANSLGMELFASPFDESAVELHEKLGMPAYKVASFEIGDHILLKRVAKTGKPVIVSTGIASLSDIEEALGVLRENGSGPVCLLKCTSAYPTPIEEVNLRTMPNLAETFGCLSGLSDHTKGLEVPVAATALGARMIEKHMRLSDDPRNPDNEFSLLPGEFANMVTSVRAVEKAMGRVAYGRPKAAEWGRSLYACKDIKRGELFTKENIRSVRPGNGLHTRHYDEVIGATAAYDIGKDTPMSMALMNQLRIRSLQPVYDQPHTFRWANDPDTIKFSATRSEKVLPGEHYTFLYNNAPFAYIAHMKGIPVAMIRLAPTHSRSGDTRNVSIVVDPRRRGQGLGGQALFLAIEKARQLDVATLKATVLEKNVASTKLFKKLGFGCTHVIAGVQNFVLSLE